MRKICQRVLAAGLLVSSCLAFGGCRGEPETTAPVGCTADLIVNGNPVLFVEESQKQTWEEPLAKLLANVEVPYGEKGEILGEEPIDPDSPSVPMNYCCGLLDVNLDGVPELLVHPFGYFGSSGCATYYAYDIHTGQKIGEIDDGCGEDTWCVYYDIQEERFRLVGQYWLRGGWSARDRYLSFLTYYAELGEYGNDIYLHTFHHIDANQEILEDPDPTDSYYVATWEEIYSNTSYFVDGEMVYLDDYYDAYDRFVADHIRIPETTLQLIRWDDVSEDEDSYEEKAKKMAKALISTDQKFLVYPKISKGGGV